MNKRGSPRHYRRSVRVCNRNLSGYDMLILFVDGIYESLRQSAVEKAILCALAILSNGCTITGHQWQCSWFNSCCRRVLAKVNVKDVWCTSLEISPTDSLNMLKKKWCPKSKNVFYQTDREVAMLFTTNIINDYADKYSGAIRCFQDDLESCLNHIDFPAGHCKRIRTTNLLKRAFLEQRRRTKVILRFLNEERCLKLVYDTLIHISDKWRRVSMSKYELSLPRNVRKLNGFKNEESEFITMKLLLNHFQFYRKNYSWPTAFLMLYFVYNSNCWNVA